MLICVGFIFLFVPFATLDQSTSEDFLSDGKGLTKCQYKSGTFASNTILFDSVLMLEYGPLICLKLEMHNKYLAYIYFFAST